MASGLSPIERPNGKLYRPRALRAELLGDEDELTGVIVFGTLTVEEARPVAEASVAEYMRAYFGGNTPEESAAEAGYALKLSGDPEPVWRRKQFVGMWEDEPRYTFEPDDVRGAFGYMWDLDYDFEAVDWESTRSDGVMPPPLDIFEP